MEISCFPGGCSKGMKFVVVESWYNSTPCLHEKFCGHAVAFYPLDIFRILEQKT